MALASDVISPLVDHLRKIGEGVEAIKFNDNMSGIIDAAEHAGGMGDLAEALKVMTRSPPIKLLLADVNAYENDLATARSMYIGADKFLTLKEPMAKLVIPDAKAILACCGVMQAAGKRFSSAGTAKTALEGAVAKLPKKAGNVPPTHLK